MAMLLGMVRLAPFVIMPLVRAFSGPLRREERRALGRRRRAGQPARTAATAAALLIGLSVVVVNGDLASSFDDPIKDQIDAASPAT